MSAVYTFKYHAIKGIYPKAVLQTVSTEEHYMENGNETPNRKDIVNFYGNTKLYYVSTCLLIYLVAIRKRLNFQWKENLHY